MSSIRLYAHMFGALLILAGFLGQTPSAGSEFAKYLIADGFFLLLLAGFSPGSRIFTALLVLHMIIVGVAFAAILTYAVYSRFS